MMHVLEQPPEEYLDNGMNLDVWKLNQRLAYIRTKYSVASGRALPDATYATLYEKIKVLKNADGLWCIWDVE